MRHPKGFTLMEILAVILVIAVVVAMASPVFRAVRFEMRHAQARTGAKKVAEAVKSYYQASRGQVLKGCFSPMEDTIITTGPTDCNSPAATGKPGSRNDSTDVEQLFACGYLSAKDFTGLPYKFCTYKPTELTNAIPTDLVNSFYAVVYAVDDHAGSKYYKAPPASLPGYIFVDGRMDVLDTY